MTIIAYVKLNCNYKWAALYPSEQEQMNEAIRQITEWNERCRGRVMLGLREDTLDMADGRQAD